MTLPRTSNSMDQILVAEHHWTDQDTCLIPDLGQEKSCLSLGHQTTPERKKLYSLLKKYLKDKRTSVMNSHWWHFGRSEHQRESWVKANVAHRGKINPWERKKEQKRFSPDRWWLLQYIFSQKLTANVKECSVFPCLKGIDVFYPE